MGKSSPGWCRCSDSQSLKHHCSTVLLPSHTIPTTSLSMLLLVTPVPCGHVVYNSYVVWFPLCCKGQKSPALSRPDIAAGEWHRSWRSLTKCICTTEERGLLLSYAGLHVFHERKSIFVWSFLVLPGSDMGLRLSLSIYCNPVLCVYAPTQIKPVLEWRIGIVA